PLLNGAIEKMNQKAHFTLVAVIFAIGAVQMFVNISAALINRLIGFAAVYFVVAYMKKYMANYCSSAKKNGVALAISFGVFLALAVVKYVVGMKSDYMKNVFALDGDFSPILLIALLSLFNLFKLMKLESRAINYLASCSLFVYCFHENLLLRTIIRPMFYEYVFGINPDLYFLWVIVLGVGMFLCAYLLSVVFKETVHRLTAFVSKKICKFLTSVIEFFFKKSLGSHTDEQTDEIDLNAQKE
ncbi:MAG: acyltransferase, partial [Clostridiales bacterium]|nr:acyltransferase [Clostridiales bacterium]